jgi:hypothetical protein
MATCANSQPAPSTELLGIDVQQLARHSALVAHNKRCRVERLQTRQAERPERAADGGNAAPDHSANGAHRHASAAKPLNALHELDVQARARSVGSGAQVSQAIEPRRLEALLPLPGRAQADPGGLGRRDQPHCSHALDQQLATLIRRSGILVAVHPVGSSAESEASITPVSQNLPGEQAIETSHLDEPRG